MNKQKAQTDHQNFENILLNQLLSRQSTDLLFV